MFKRTSCPLLVLRVSSRCLIYKVHALPQRQELIQYIILFCCCQVLFSNFFRSFSAPKVQIQNSHPAAHRSRSELLYDTTSHFACQALFSFCRQPSGASKTMYLLAWPLSRESLTMLPPFSSPVNTFFHFSSFLFFRRLFLLPAPDIRAIVCPFPGCTIPHLQTLFTCLKAESPPSTCTWTRYILV